MCRLLGLLLGGVMLTMVSGCAYMQHDAEINTDVDPVRPGPGIFTGRSGEWTIMRK